jgi:hypothetical protein
MLCLLQHSTGSAAPNVASGPCGTQRWAFNRSRRRARCDVAVPHRASPPHRQNKGKHASPSERSLRLAWPAKVSDSARCARSNAPAPPRCSLRSLRRAWPAKVSRTPLAALAPPRLLRQGVADSARCARSAAPAPPKCRGLRSLRSLRRACSSKASRTPLAALAPPHLLLQGVADSARCVRSAAPAPRRGRNPLTLA